MSARLALNDVASTQHLAGAIRNLGASTPLVRIESRRRLSFRLALTIEARIFTDAAPGSLLGQFNLHDFFQVRLDWYIWQKRACMNASAVGQMASARQGLPDGVRAAICTAFPFGESVILASHGAFNDGGHLVVKTARLTRKQATRQRREEILTAALECFSTLGYDRTTLEDIRERSEASTGSIYHHFKSKRQIAAELYIEGRRQFYDAGRRALKNQRHVKTGLTALVGSYLNWVRRNQDFAVFLLSNQDAEFMESVEAVLADMEHDFQADVGDWMRQHIEAGRLPALPPDIYVALLRGPTEVFAHQWLRGRTKTSLKAAAEMLGKGAYASLTDFL